MNAELFITLFDDKGNCTHDFDVNITYEFAKKLCELNATVLAINEEYTKPPVWFLGTFKQFKLIEGEWLRITEKIVRSNSKIQICVEYNYLKEQARREKVS